MIYSHPDLVGEYNSIPLMEVEEVTSNIVVVFRSSELELKNDFPGVVGVRMVKRGLWTGTIERN